MPDSQTHRNLRIFTDGGPIPYIKVPVAQLEKLQTLLKNENVSHWVESVTISFDEGPEITTVNLGRGTDVLRIQALLDQVREGAPMPLADQIDELGQRSLKELNRLRAYYEDTIGVWRLAQQLADEGRSIIIRNRATHRILNAPEIHGLAQIYVTDYLAESVFEKSIALFEDFVFGLLNVWLGAHPLGIPHKERQLTYSAVFDAPNKQAIVQHIIDRELDELKYKNVRALFAYLNDRINLGLPSEAQLATLAEIKATRDILVHNAGIINDTYIRKAGKEVRYKVGDRVEIQEPYLYASWTLIENIFSELTAVAVRKA